MSEFACVLGFEITEPAELVLQIAAAAPSSEKLTAPVEVTELPGRQHYLRAQPGWLAVSYEGTTPDQRPEPPPVTEVERIVALRPSRYCPSDRLAGFAAKEFGGADHPATAVRAITSWVFERLAYVAGSSGPTTDAVDTMLSGAGVCRDYAHLVATLCRAVNIPARVAAVYAPGLFPMDFHLVVETALDGKWRVWDATRLAPRPSLIRIATGRDAADTALATTISGALTMPEITITAVAGGFLPNDDHDSLVSLP